MCGACPCDVSREEKEPWCIGIREVATTLSHEFFSQFHFNGHDIHGFYWIDRGGQRFKGHQ